LVEIRLMVLEKKSFKVKVDARQTDDGRRRTDGRTTDGETDGRTDDGRCAMP